MFLSLSEWIVTGIIGIPFAIVILIPTIIAVIYLIYLIVETIRYKTKAGLSNIKNMLEEETTEISDYEPAIMGYLVNKQKIGRREICSTLFDLIARGYIKISLKKGLVGDNDGEYILKRCDDEKSKIKGFEINLIVYLFGDNKEISIDILNRKLYKKNLDKDFLKRFLRLIQITAKKRDFFSPKTGKKKVVTYNIINKVVTVIATVMSFITTVFIEGADAIDDVDIFGIIFLFSLATTIILWVLKFFISFMFNISCYYNDFSEKGMKDYRKWIGFKNFLKRCSSIPDHPLMGVMVWERYYAYSIGLKCSKKFFKQMKKMKVVDNSIDIPLFESFNFIVSSIGTSTMKIKKISLDKYGGSHVDY